MTCMVVTSNIFVGRGNVLHLPLWNSKIFLYTKFGIKVETQFQKKG